MPQATIDEAKVEVFLGQLVVDFGGAMRGVLNYVGDRLGLYQAMATAGSVTPEELASATGTHPRMIREWLLALAAAGYVTYDGEGRFLLPPEHAAALADEASPANITGFIESIVALYQSADKAVEAVRTGKGLAWGDHDHRLFSGTERFFRTAYRHNLVQTWIPALDGVDEKLTRGARVADVGCGHGASTIIMALAYPNSTFVGFDYHAPSIERARAAAAEAGVADRVTFEVASGTDYPGAGYDLIAFFDCLHDMGDPIGTAKHTRRALADGGAVLLVEPFANDDPAENLNPVGALYYAASALICTPNSLAEEGPALGAQAGPSRTAAILREGGFGSVRNAVTTPFNFVIEARA